MNKRDFLLKLGYAGGVVALPFVVQAEGQRAAKEVTTAGLASSVLRLMEKAQLAGMKHEVEALRECAEKILRGGK